MTSQVLPDQSNGVRGFVALVRAHVAVTRRLSAQLMSDHGLTINDYEVLLRLARAPDRRLRRVDLAQEVLLTASGITRLLDGLEQSGYVERAACDSDRRVVYAVLTETGLHRSCEMPRRATSRRSTSSSASTMTRRSSRDSAISCRGSAIRAPRTARSTATLPSARRETRAHPPAPALRPRSARSARRAAQAGTRP